MAMNKDVMIITRSGLNFGGTDPLQLYIVVRTWRSITFWMDDAELVVDRELALDLAERFLERHRQGPTEQDAG